MAEPPSLPSSETPHDELVHEFKNHLAVIIGFCDLLLRDLPEDDARRHDIAEMRKAGLNALTLLPRIASHTQ